MMPGPHKRAPLSVRLTEDDEEWLRMHAEYTGQPVNALLRLAVADLRAKVTGAHLVTFGEPCEPGEISR